jgi:hypothetical protein
LYCRRTESPGLPEPPLCGFAKIGRSGILLLWPLESFGDEEGEKARAQGFAELLFSLFIFLSTCCAPCKNLGKESGLYIPK